MPIATPQDIIIRAMKAINALAAGETPAGEDTQDGLDVLNSMIRSWNAEGTAIYGELISAFNLVNGTQTYTYGSGGVFNATRPQKITKANVILTSVSPVQRIPVEVITYPEWADISIQAQPSNTYPSVLYPDMAFPLMTLYLWGVPGSNLQLELFTWQQLQIFAALSDSFSLPPEYERALIYNLAVEFAPMFGVPLSPVTAGLASSSKAIIEKLNAVTPVMECDEAITATTPAFVSIYSGS